MAGMKYDLGNESEDFKRGWEARKEFDLKLLRSMPSYWIDRIIRMVKQFP